MCFQRWFYMRRIYPFSSENKMPTAVFTNNTSKYIDQSQSTKCTHQKVNMQQQQQQNVSKEILFPTTWSDWKVWEGLIMSPWDILENRQNIKCH